jgi:hypothetical protein
MLPDSYWSSHFGHPENSNSIAYRTRARCTKGQGRRKNDDCNGSNRVPQQPYNIHDVMVKTKKSCVENPADVIVSPLA